MRTDARSFSLALTALTLLAGLAAPLAAQGRNSATLIATATVVSTRLGAATVRGLEFGTLRAGEAATVQPDGRTAAAWRLAGAPEAAVLLTFDLPAELTRTDGAAALPIRFGTAAGRWGGPAGRTFDPAAATLARFGSAELPALDVRLGGTVAAPRGTPGGTYAGTVTLNLLYL